LKDRRGIGGADFAPISEKWVFHPRHYQKMVRIGTRKSAGNRREIGGKSAGNRRADFWNSWFDIGFGLEFLGRPVFSKGGVGLLVWDAIPWVVDLLA